MGQSPTPFARVFGAAIGARMTKVICTQIYTARIAQVAASLLQACGFAVIKPISGCVRIACSGLMITSLLQVVNRLNAS